MLSSRPLTAATTTPPSGEDSQLTSIIGLSLSHFQRRPHPFPHTGEGGFSYPWRANAHESTGCARVVGRLFLTAHGSALRLTSFSTKRGGVGAAIECSHRLSVIGGYPLLAMLQWLLAPDNTRTHNTSSRRGWRTRTGGHCDRRVNGFGKYGFPVGWARRREISWRYQLGFTAPVHRSAVAARG